MKVFKDLKVLEVQSFRDHKNFETFSIISLIGIQEIFPLPFSFGFPQQKSNETKKFGWGLHEKFNEIFNR